MQSIHRAKPLIISLAGALPPFIAFNAYKDYDSREISKDEIHLSHRRLAALAPAPLQPILIPNKLAASGAMNMNMNDDANLESSWDLLQKSGVIFVPRLLNDDQLKYWNKNLSDAMSTRTSTSNSNRTCSPHNNRGRLHSHQESKRDPYNSHFHRLISSLPEIQAIVKLYFQRHLNIHSKDSDKCMSYRLTQTQFLLAKPGSQHQIWHRDNVAPGLTLLVALDHVTSNGPTELLLGSHKNDNDGNGNGNGDDNNDDEVLLGCLCAGDAILYDARVIHRGRGYNDSPSDRPVLILRWDAVSTPPPGAGFIVTNYVDCVGSVRIFIKRAQDLFESLFG